MRQEPSTRWRRAWSTGCLIAPALCFLPFPHPGFGQTIGFSVASDSLVEVELETGVTTLVGNVGTTRMNGLTMSQDGALWAVSSLTNDLWRIDPSTADSTRIGTVDVTVGVDTGLTFDACGSLWLVTNQVLYELDPTTAQSIFRADLAEEVAGLTSLGQDLVGITTSSPRFVMIDSETGNLDSFGDPIPYPTFEAGLDVDGLGELWAVFVNDSGITPTWIRRAVRFDPSTGETETFHNDSAGFAGNLTLTPPSGTCALPEDIPVDSPAALVLLGLLMATSGFFLIRTS